MRKSRKLTKKITKRLYGYVALLCAACLAFSTPAHAAQPGITSENFDYAWYLAQHPDLAAVVSADDKEVIWNFYQTVGEPAGWLGRQTKESLLTEWNFDYMRYATENPDLAALYGIDRHALYEHYITCGMLEGRAGYSSNENINAKIKMYDMVESITQGCTTDREKVKAVHDWMVKNIAYDYDNYLAGTIPSTSYGIAGPILHGKSVCQGYAETFDFFMELLGIDCEVISGTANNGSGNGWGGHAWNKVKLDGQWLYIDVTWDDPLPDRGNTVYWYKYYLVTDPTFGGNHRAD